MGVGPSVDGGIGAVPHRPLLQLLLHLASISTAAADTGTSNIPHNGGSRRVRTDLWGRRLVDVVTHTQHRRSCTATTHANLRGGGGVERTQRHRQTL